MKLSLLLLLFSIGAWARPIVLISYFDIFGSAPFNNSEKVSKLLLEQFRDHPEFDLRLCSLETIFDKSYAQLEDCVKELSTSPKLVLGLGEYNCNLKIETMGRNRDKTKGPDNAAIERMNTVIIPNGPSELGFNYPLADMYCALPQKNRLDIEISNNAGSFVCNNLAYQFANNYQDIEFGFIHVPASTCRNLEAKTKTTVANLGLMIRAAIKSTEVKRLGTKKEELELEREVTKNNKCLHEFYKRAKGIDEKGFWSFLEVKQNHSYIDLQ